MKSKINKLDIKDRCHFQISLRYEIFFALNSLLDPNSRIHSGWRQNTLSRLPGSFFSEFSGIGSAWEIWSVMPAMIRRELANPDIKKILFEISSKPSRQLQETILLGLIHSEETVSALLDKGQPLAKALSNVPKVKQEWLAYIGLYPYQKSAPIAVALERLISAPEIFRKSVIKIIEIFWQSVFQHEWNRIAAQYQRSLEEKERLFSACTLEEFFRQALLKIDVSEERALFKAARGGYTLLFKNIKNCYFLPSAFNDRRYWSALEEKGKPTVVYFPFFDPTITLDWSKQMGDLAEPQSDPALIFRALGDSTRYAMASLLARKPMSSIEVAEAIRVSKPTVSHHMNEFRKAGLISEQYVAGSVSISLRRDVLEKLSEVSVRKFFESEGKVELKKTRSK